MGKYYYNIFEGTPPLAELRGHTIQILFNKNGTSYQSIGLIHKVGEYVGTNTLINITSLTDGTHALSIIIDNNGVATFKLDGVTNSTADINSVTKYIGGYNAGTSLYIIRVVIE